MENKRKFTRLDLELEAEIKDDSKTYRADVLNLSLKGILLNSRLFTGQMGEIYRIEITLSTEIVLSFKSQLLHQDDTHFGFKFVSQSLDSFAHLRSLLEYNIDDPEQIQAELFFLIESN